MALDAGLAQARIVTEEKGRSTFESVMGCVSIMGERGWIRATVVSDAYHLLRARLVFRAFGIRTTGSAAEGGREANRLFKWWYFHIRECVALPWYVLLVVKEKFSVFLTGFTE
jgi:uncharacterized SAM-binding protein YcdF (DUF218 family)